jgi:hypothetical protein
MKPKLHGNGAIRPGCLAIFVIYHIIQQDERPIAVVPLTLLTYIFHIFCFRKIAYKIQYLGSLVKVLESLFQFFILIFHPAPKAVFRKLSLLFDLSFGH